MLSKALVFRACQVQPGQPKPAQCTPDEEKAEADQLVMWGRLQFAHDLVNETTVTLGPKSLGTLKDLVAVRFQDDPSIISQV